MSRHKEIFGIPLGKGHKGSYVEDRRSPTDIRNRTPRGKHEVSLVEERGDEGKEVEDVETG